MKYLKIVFILFLLFEIYYSFHRHKYFPLDGDMPAMVFGYQEVKHDPFGLNVLLHDSLYGGPNRYFAIMSACIYIKNAPLAFQFISSPIKSIYLAFAFFKTFTQFFLIYIIAMLVTGKWKLWDFDLLLVCALIAPLFQIYGYQKYMGVIDYSITYTFFYAFALCSVILFFVPFFNAAFERRSSHFSPLLITGLLLLAVFNAFNGPLNPGLMVVICSFALCYSFITKMINADYSNFKNRLVVAIRNTPINHSLIFIFTILLSIYSLYISKNNSENFWETIPLDQRYQKLWEGIIYYYTSKIGPLLLIIMILINGIIIFMRREHIPHSELILKAILWLFCLSFIYFLLLPLGGYRNYRPYIIRNDTLVPVTVAIIFVYGLSVFHILKNSAIRYKWAYYLLVAGCSIVFINADTKIRKYNKCEINALEKLSKSKEEIVFLDNNCSVVSWLKVLDYKESNIKAELLQYWGVTENKKLYYQHDK